MAAPLSGAGQQQQVPLSQALQPIGNDQTRQVRQDDQEPRTNEIQARGAAIASTQDSGQAQRDEAREALSTERLSERVEDTTARNDRGGNVDITV